MSVSFTAESGTAAFTSVSASATPEMAFQGQSVSVAPAAASTVAKPIHARSHLLDLKTGEYDSSTVLSLSTISSFCFKYVQSLKKVY